MWNLSLVGDSLQSLCEETQTVSAADPAQTQDRKSSTTGLHFFKIKHLWPHLCSHNFSLLEPVKATPLKRKIKCTAGVSRLLRDHSAQPVLEKGFFGSRKDSSYGQMFSNTEKPPLKCSVARLLHFFCVQTCGCSYCMDHTAAEALAVW